MDIVLASPILCDDMMTEILVRLPPESMFRCLTVSKKWNGLLTSPEFLSHYARFFRKQRIGSRSLLGFFKNTRLLRSLTPRMPFLYCGDDPKLGKSFSPDLSPDPGNFITSSNGLVLCESDPSSYYVLNPVTRKHVSLPPPNKNHHQGWLSVGFYCDEDGDDDLAPRYQVVIADAERESNELCIETYSSETKEWRESVLVGTSSFKVFVSDPPDVIKGVFYWWALDRRLVVHDPHNKNHVQLIQLPSTDPERKWWLHSRALNQTPDGRLIYSAAFADLIEIWQLPKRELGATTIEEKEWVLIHTVSTQTLSLRSPSIREGMSSCKTRPWNPLLTTLQGSILIYDMETHVLETIMCFPPDCRQGQWWHPFFEPTSFSPHLLA